MSRFAGTRVLLIAPADDALHSHTAQRQRALERLGCDVIHLDPWRPPSLVERLRRRVRLADRIARALAEEPDVVLVTGGDETLGPALAADLRRRTDAVWVNWLTGDSCGRGLLQAVASVYDVVAAAASDVAASLRGTGAAKVLYLPLAADPSVYRPVRSRPEYRSSVAFVGTATPHRERMLSNLVDLGLAVWGPGWKQTRLAEHCRGELVTVADYVRAYAGALVAVNIHGGSDLKSREGCGCNRRVFELAAIGVPQVTDPRHDLAHHFEPSQVLAFRSATELRELVSEAIREPVWAEQLARSARTRALREHTYMHRMERLLGVLRR